MKMKFIKKFESFLTDLDVPPTKIINNNDEGDDEQFRYDFKITGMRFKIKSEESIKSEVDILTYNYGGHLNKYKINTGYVCMDVKNYYFGKEFEMLNMDIYYSLNDTVTNSGRLNIKEIIPEISRIIYENVEKPFKYDGNLGYEFWDKQAWLTI